MSWRTVIVSSHAKLDLQVGFMSIRNEDGARRVILDEIDVLIVESTAVSLTAALLEELVKRKVRVVFCDHRHLPLAELTPYHGCHDSSRRLRQQMAWSPLLRQQVWSRIVSEKILNQAALLRRHDRMETADLLTRYAGEVQDGDADNREGVAARCYFIELFGNDFSRDRPCDVNAALDYGYQVLLSVFARELSAEGFSTELGLFHENIYNPFNLASDFMEPFRPYVDAVVLTLFSDEATKFDKSVRRALVALLHDEIKFRGSMLTLINAAVACTRSITDGLTSGDLSGLRFPDR